MKTTHKILFISDTHTMHEDLDKHFDMPIADFIVHAGDFTGQGSEHHTRKFLKWFSNLNMYDHKIFIAGNHDWLFERNRSWGHELVNEYSKKYSKIHYLEDNGVEICGLKFWGSPVSRPFCNWAFNRLESKMEQHWKAIPEDTDILITHSPPYMIMDYAESGSAEHTGSESLYREVFDRIKPMVHVFGHIHEQYGIKEIDGIKFINASNLDGGYSMVNPPILMEVEVDI